MPKIKVAPKDGEMTEDIGSLFLDPRTTAAYVIDAFSIGDQFNYQLAGNALHRDLKAIKSGDLSRLEEMLYSQAAALNMMFARLSEIAIRQQGLPQFESHMRFALKAQKQSRANLQALIQLKQPSTSTFVKQANIANVHQQINNLENFSNRPNELLEVHDGKRLDIGTQGAPKRINSKMETMGEVDGRQNSGRKSKV